MADHAGLRGQEEEKKMKKARMDENEDKEKWRTVMELRRRTRQSTKMEEKPMKMEVTEDQGEGNDEAKAKMEEMTSDEEANDGGKETREEEEGQKVDKRRKRSKDKNGRVLKPGMGSRCSC
mmetsp:Transcript_35212/g.49117  ORF Transcript_35212/g.49117 Transcript_35212/m.49117 type:complete len:121 (+) Transcript_35212:292-654(+)